MRRSVVSWSKCAMSCQTCLDRTILRLDVVYTSPHPNPPLDNPIIAQCLSLSLLMSRVRFTHNVQIPIMSLPAFPPHNLHPSVPRLLQVVTKHTLQCSHRFLIALPTFIPRLCCCAPLRLVLAACVVGSAIGRARMVEKARMGVVESRVVRRVRNAGRLRRRDAMVAVRVVVEMLR
jgi:hypothetical protein